MNLSLLCIFTEYFVTTLRVYLTDESRSLALSLSRSLALSLCASLSLTIANSAHAACYVVILTPTQPNVGTYNCDLNGDCVLIDSHFDANAPYTPLDPSSETVIDIGTASTNANSPAINQAKKAAGETDAVCAGDGNATNTLAPVIATGTRLSPGFWTIRLFGPSSGSLPPLTTERAASPISIVSDKSCSDTKNIRRDAAVAAYAAAVPFSLGQVRLIFVTTSDGKRESWARDSDTQPFDLLSSDCLNPNN